MSLSDSSDGDESLSPQHGVGGRPGDDEDEFEFADSQYTNAGANDKKGPLKRTLDKPFDEVHEVSDSNDDSHASPRGSSPPGGKSHAGPSSRAPQHQQSFDEDEDEHDASASMNSDVSPPPKKSSKHSKKEDKKSKKSSRESVMVGKPGNMAMSGKPGNMAPKNDAPQKADSSSEEESDEEESSAQVDSGAGGDGAKPSQARLYNPADYKHLVVSSEIQGLFEYIGRHKPTDIDLETKLKPFIPDYIPAVGEIDAFLKVPPPEESKDKKQQLLGLTVLDEPAAHQSDPTVLELSLRAVNKQVISKHATVGTIEHADKNQSRVLKWINSIEEVHRKKPPPHVHYARPMPDIEQLMQVWPPEFEELLKSSSTALPDMNNLDCDVGAFARMVCAIMDIPVYDKVTESLHVLFTLYSEFQNHAYFQH